MRRSAFTLVELLVVIAILGLLSTVAVVATNSARMNARNTQRKANMMQISKALELYYQDNNNTYPSTSGAWFSVTTGWGTAKSDSGAGGWIPNLAPTYMATLPRDPNTNRVNPNSSYGPCQTTATSNAFVYRSDGVDYKVIANCLPEGTLSGTDPFLDPPRPTYNWAVYTPGASSW